MSMTAPPPSKNNFSTSPSILCSSVPGWTSKLPEVPMPMTGIFSPVEGMARISIVAPSALQALFRLTVKAPSAAALASIVRRVNMAGNPYRSRAQLDCATPTDLGRQLRSAAHACINSD